jgi:hypothetical protein
MSFNSPRHTQWLNWFPSAWEQAQSPQLISLEDLTPINQDSIQLRKLLKVILDNAGTVNSLLDVVTDTNSTLEDWFCLAFCFLEYEIPLSLEIDITSYLVRIG